jgi:hypothetical protein
MSAAAVSSDVAKSGLHPSMQAIRLSLCRKMNFDAGACSLGQDSRPSAKPKTPAALTKMTGFRSLRAIQADVWKGMIS